MAVSGTSGRSQPVYNPATGKVARQVALASADYRSPGDEVAHIGGLGEGFRGAHGGLRQSG